MSSFRKLLLLIFIIAFVIVGGYAGYTYATTNFEEGTIAGTSYESSFLDIRIDLPSDFNMASASKLSTPNASVDSKTLDGVEMLALSDTTLCNVVIYTVESNPFVSISNSVDLVKEQLSGKIDYTFSDTTVKRLAGEQYYYLHAQATSSGRRLDQDIYMTKIGVRFCVIVVTYDSNTPESVREKDSVTASITACE